MSDQAVLNFLRTYRDQDTGQCTIPLHGIAFHMNMKTDDVRRIVNRLAASGAIEMKWQYNADYDGTPAYAATYDEAKGSDSFGSKLRGGSRLFRVLAGLVFAIFIYAQNAVTAPVVDQTASYATFRRRRLCWGAC